MKRILLLGFIAILSMATIEMSVAQVARKMMPRTVNIINKHNLAPSLSADGKVMIYLSTYSGSGEPELKYTTRIGKENWSTPKDVKEVNKFLDLNFIGGFCLSADGKTIYFTSKRGQGIGEFDILFTEFRGGKWSPARNLGKPVNTIGNDAAPSISPDGQFLYFMRCKTMNRYEASGCEIWVSKRRNKDFWETPTKMPYPINQGNDQFPKIFPDNQTMIFSSSRSGGKGKLDFYFSHLENDTWTKPKNLEFLNSPNDDAYISLTAKGNEVYFSTLYREKESLIVSKLPKEYRGQKVVLMEGVVLDTDSEEPLKAFVQVYDAESNKRILYARSDEYDGTFHTVFPVKNVSDFSVISTEKGYIHESKLYNASEINGSIKESKTFKLTRVRDGLQYTNESLQFLPQSSTLDPSSQLELKRIVKILKDNPRFNLEFGVHTDLVIKDSVRRSEDLTEMIVDTVYVFMEDPDLSLNANDGDGMMNGSNQEAAKGNETVEEDEFLTFEEANERKETQATSPGEMKKEDANDSTPRIEKLIYTYHNDRTQLQAESLLEALIKLGVPDRRISATGHGDQFPKYRNPSQTEGNAKNKRVEIRFIER